MILPSSKTRVDRAIILRHLLSGNVSRSKTLVIFNFLSLIEDDGFDLILLFLLQHDPFNRAALTTDMLIPDIDLKARIDEFVKSHQSRKRARGEDSSK